MIRIKEAKKYVSMGEVHHNFTLFLKIMLPKLIFLFQQLKNQIWTVNWKNIGLGTQLRGCDKLVKEPRLF